MNPRLNIAHSRDHLDPDGSVPAPRWDDFTQHYTDRIAQILQERYPQHPVDVRVSPNEIQTDTMQCSCTMCDPCPHEAMLCWIGDSESWLQALDYALEKTGLTQPVPPQNP